MNLRSAVAQFGRSMGSRRYFSSSAMSSNVSKEAQERGAAAAAGVKSLLEPMTAKHYCLYLWLGFCAYTGFETIQLLEYVRTSSRAIKEIESQRREV